MSLLLTQRPDRCKLILVDPKMVELSMFKDVPHLMCPIVNELKRDFEYENQRRINDQVYSELRRSYEIEFDLDPEKFDEAFVEYLKSKDGSND